MSRELCGVADNRSAFVGEPHSGATNAQTTTTTTRELGARLGTRKEPCVVCELPVFLAEKLVIARNLYHRTCFRCARCNNQLTIGNYYETEEGQYCCETCPDEEVPSTPTMHQGYNKTALLSIDDVNREQSSAYQRSLSDEEKSERKGLKEAAVAPHTDDDYTSFISMSKDIPVSEATSHTSLMRSNFMANHLLSERSAELSGDDSYSLSINEEPHDDIDSTAESLNESETRASPERLPRNDDVSASPYSGSRASTPHESLGGALARDVARNRESDSVNNKLERSVDSGRLSDNNQHLTAISPHDVDSKRVILSEEDTKDTAEVVASVESAHPSPPLSLVRQRLQKFESQAREGERNKAYEKRQGSVEGIAEKSSPPRTRTVSDDDDDDDDDNDVAIGCAKVNDSSPIVPTAKRRTSSPREEDVAVVPRSSSRVSSDDLVAHESEEALELPERKMEANAADVVKEAVKEKEEPSSVTSSVVEVTTLNAKGIDLNTGEDYPDDLNPFKSDDDGGDDHNEDGDEKKEESKKTDSRDSRISTNPFGSSDEEEEPREIAPPRPAVRSKTANKGNQPGQELSTKRRLQAPQINLNPFWSDEEEHADDAENAERPMPHTLPIPKPRTIKQIPDLTIPSSKSDLNRGGVYASNTSIASSGSTTTPGGTYRKKKPAPQPPAAKEIFLSDSCQASPHPKPKSDGNTSSTYLNVSPRTTPRVRKAKPAPPPPPVPTSTPHRLSLRESSSPVIESEDIDDDSTSQIWEDQKSNKDEANRNKQSLSIMPNEESQGYINFADKSAQGKWKRKKGPAPPRPIPHRRKIKVMSTKDVKLELDEIELQQQGLERQGVRLEQLIRSKSESGAATEDTSLTSDVEELVLELFALVNEKNELFRRQAELMLLRRQQRLEEEHAEMEYQIRCLMCQPEATKTDFDKQREESLIQRLVEIVERRNEIVECLEMDRRREVEEDRSIHKQMGLFAAKSKGDITAEGDDSSYSVKMKKGKVKEKGKEKKSKKGHKKDADKDVDETEVKLKRHKKKWF